MKRTYRGLLGAFVGFAALLYSPSAALAQVAPPLGTVRQFGALGNSAVTGSTGTGTVVNGDVGSSPTPSVTNFPPSTVSAPFTLHLSNDTTVQQARTDAIAAYNFLAAEGPGTVLAAQLDGDVLTTGIYSFMGGAADLAATGTLTLNGPGIFIFQVDDALTANVNSNVVGTANPCNVYWRVGTSATLNGVTFRGNVFADASITVGDGADVTGRVIAGTGATGAVTMAGGGGNTIAGCSSATTCPAITVNPATLPNPVAETAYNATVTGSGGVGPYTFGVTSGALPSGLVLNGATGAITGTPTSIGTSSFTITATDTSTFCSGFRAYSFTVAATCPTITVNPATLPTPVVGTAYNATVTASGGSGSYTFAVTSGALPDGLELNDATGAITGTPTSVENSSFTITATDTSTSCSGFRGYSLPAVAATGVPILDYAGLAILLALLAGGGLFVMKRFSI